MSRSACEVCGETYDYCGQCGTCHKCMGEDIDRLKAELEEANKWEISYYNIASDLLDWKEKAEEAERQLAETKETTKVLSGNLKATLKQRNEARAENERLNDKITRLMRVEQMDKHIVDQARQEAARECTKIVHNLGCTYGLGTAERGLLVYAADLLLQKLGLEEVRDETR